MNKSIRMKTRDAAFKYRMGAGFPGDVNRTHPASIEPCLIDVDNPPDAYGQAVVVDTVTHGVRMLGAADASNSTALAIHGITTRPYPTQQASGTNFGAASLGAATPPTSGVTDVAREAYMIVKVPAGQAPVKGGAVYVFCAASETGHTQGGFEAAAVTDKTVLVSNAKFNNSPDADGNVEVVVYL